MTGAMTVAEIETATEAFSSRRVVILAGVLVIIGALVELIVRRSIEGALSLTAAGVVAIINFRWLEALVGRVIQPGRPQLDRGSALRFLARLALLGVVHLLDGGLTGLWMALIAFIGARALTLLWRIRGDKWIVTGAHRSRAATT